MKGKVGILCAGDSELEPFIPYIEGCLETEKALLKFYHGTMNGVEVVALFSGVCKVNAAVAAQILIDTYGCEVIINSGTAGGMDEDLKILDTVISTESAYWDVNEDILTEFHPWMKSVFFKADEELIALVKDFLSGFPSDRKVFFGRMVTGEKFIEDSWRGEINRTFQPLSVDMETAAIAHVCHVNHIPFVAIRTITDTADHSGGDVFEENCEAAAGIAAEITRGLLGELARRNR